MEFGVFKGEFGDAMQGFGGTQGNLGVFWGVLKEIWVPKKRSPNFRGPWRDLWSFRGDFGVLREDLGVPQGNFGVTKKKFGGFGGL